ncbi:MAG: AAA family ATPase [Bacteroidia bacterium]|nr:AAA family ATPase [Bacteroidia bacterium]
MSRSRIKGYRIYLIGFMGAGKTTLGKRLANKIGFNFFDIDDLIETEENRSINDIFLEKGAEHFRKLERKVLNQTNFKQKVVYATGGGTPFFFDNMQWMNKNGTTIYVRHTEDLLFGRLRSSKSNRPLISKLSDEELRRFIIDHLVQREKFYNQSKVIVDGKGIKVQNVVEKLIIPKKFSKLDLQLK